MKRVLILILLAAVGLVGFARAEEKLKPRKVEVDSDFDGVVDRVEYYDEMGEVERVESDTNLDGMYDEWVYYKNGEVEKAEKDTNADGTPDTWIEY